MGKAEATKLAKEYVLKHRKSLKGSNKEISAAVNKIARALAGLKSPGDLKPAA